MGGVHLYAILGFSVNPAAKIAAARENKRVYPIGVDDSQLEGGIRRCSRDWPPCLTIG